MLALPLRAAHIKREKALEQEVETTLKTSIPEWMKQKGLSDEQVKAHLKEMTVFATRQQKQTKTRKSNITRCEDFPKIIAFCRDPQSIDAL